LSSRRRNAIFGVGRQRARAERRILPPAPGPAAPIAVYAKRRKIEYRRVERNSLTLAGQVSICELSAAVADESTETNACLLCGFASTKDIVTDDFVVDVVTSATVLIAVCLIVCLFVC